jgi:hypothetical protein
MVRFDGRHKKLALLGALLLLPILVYVGITVFPTASNQGYYPEQPIPFSHKIHAGTNKIQCTYCHTAAETSRHATIPAMNVCMNCHSVVAVNSPHIKKLKAAYDKGEPIQWIRIHELPDFVQFPHHRHVAKNISCETCHGDVKTMDRVHQDKPLTMGWCLDCHRGSTTPKHILAEKFPGDKNPRGKQVAPINCSACHY